MCTFNELIPHLRRLSNWYGNNYFPKSEYVVKYKNCVVELFHLPHVFEEFVGINIECEGIEICHIDDDVFEIIRNTRVDV